MTAFADLVSIYRKSKWIHSDRATYCADTEDELGLLVALDAEYEKTGLIISCESPKVDNTINLQIQPPKPAFGRVFEDFDAFVLGDMAHILDDVVGSSNYYIKSDDIASTDDVISSKLENYQAIKKLIHHLTEMDSYTNQSSKQLIFFSKNIFELSIDIRDKATDFSAFISQLTLEQKEIISSFIGWLSEDADATKSHHDEKKSILAFVLTDTFSHDAHLLDVLAKITDVYKSVEAQYALYISNFSYKKLLEKLSETNEKFVARINDTIGKILPQFLGLPFLTAIPTALKSADNWLVYTALILYCTMCFLGLLTQKAALDYIKEDVKIYTDTQLPKELFDRWKTNQKRINTLIRRQTALYWILAFSVILCFAYGLYKLIIIADVITIIKNILCS